MSEQRAQVDQVSEIGVKIGPGVDTSCEFCTHRWGSHYLHPVTESPVDGGTWSCPAPDCTCFGTWDVPMGVALRRAYDDRVARRLHLE